MPREPQDEHPNLVLTNLTKGMVTTVPPQDIPFEASPACENVWFDENCIKKRPALADFATSLTDENIMGFYEYRKLAGTTTLVAVTEDSFYKYTGTDWERETDGCFTGDADDAFRFTTFIDTCLVTNGKDHVKKYTGTTAADVDGGDGYQTPTYHIAKDIIMYKTRIILLHTQEDSVWCPQRFRFSNAGAFETWTSADFYDVQEKPDALVRGLRLSQKLVLYKDSSIVLCFYVGGDAIFDFTTAVESCGLLAPRSLKAVSTRNGDVHLFLARDGVKVFEGSSYVTDISEGIKDQVLAANEMTYSHRAIAWVIPRKHLYVLGLPDSDGDITSDGVWAFNYNTGAWGPWNISTAKWTGAYEYGGEGTNWVPSKAFSALVGDEKDSMEADMSSTTAYDAEAYWQTKDLVLHRLGDRYYSTLHHVEVECKGTGSLVVDYSTDAGSTWSTYGTITMTSTWTSHSLYKIKTAKRWRLRLKVASGASTWFEVRKIRIYFHERTDR